MKLVNYKFHVFTLVLLLVAVFNSAGQQAYFRIINGIPHLPVFPTTADVPSPIPGALVYSTASGKSMLYTGEVWDDFCTSLLPVATGAKTFFSIIDGVPVMPVKEAITGASISGDCYWPLTGPGIAINNGTVWGTTLTMPATLPPTTNTTVLGSSSSITGGFVLPVLSADPTGVEKGAIYLNSVSKKLVVYNGTSWGTYCFCPPIINAMVNDGWTTLTSLVGTYSYYQKNNLTESVSAALKKWYIADDATGTNKTPDGTGDTWSSYDNEKNGKYICYEVTAKTSNDSWGVGVSPWTKLWNCPPVVSDPYIYPAVAVFTTSSVNFQLEYAYSDREGNTEGTPDVKWYIADDAAGTNMVLKNSAVSYNYPYSMDDQNKYLLATISPVATGGYSPGEQKQVLQARAVKITNCAPQAGATMNGDYVFFNYPITFSHSYYDKEANTENTAGAQYRIFISSGANGTGTVTPLSTDGSYAYSYQEAHNGLYLNVGVKVAATAGWVLSDEVIKSVLINNCAPQANAPDFADNSVAISILKGAYAYYDREENAEASSAYEWWRANDAAGSGAMLVGTAVNYATATDADYNKYYSFKVTPKAAGGWLTGTQVASAYKQVTNCPPQVSGLRIDGTLTVGQEVRAGYAYYDKENQAEGTSLFQWYRDNTGVPIVGATSATYTPVAADQGHTIGVSVTPKAAAGYSTGDMVSIFTVATVP